jgi:hypothetical protein
MSNPLPPAEVRDHRERDWFWANNDVIDRYGFVIGADGIAVYMALARYADRNGQCWPSYARMAERLALSRPTVIKCLNRLVFAGLATSTPRTKPTKAGTEQPDSNLYTLLTVRAISDEERIALKEAIKAREGGKGDLLGTTTHAPSKGDLPPLPSKGDLPPLVKEIDYPGKGDLPPLVKDVVRNKTQWNKTHGTPPPSIPGGDGDDFYRELRKRKVGQTKARQIAGMGCDPARILALIDNRPNASDPNSLGRLIIDILDGVAFEHARAVAQPLTATRANLPETTVAPAEVLRQLRERR